MDAQLAIELTPLGKGVSCHRMDPGIAQEVRVLWDHGVDTVESCQGGFGHKFAEPTVRFRGNDAEGRRAFGVAVRHGLKVREVRPVQAPESSTTETIWDMVFER